MNKTNLNNRPIDSGMRFRVISPPLPSAWNKINFHKQLSVLLKHFLLKKKQKKQKNICIQIVKKKKK